MFRRRPHHEPAPHATLTGKPYEDLATWTRTQAALLGVDLTPDQVLAAAVAALMDSPVLSDDVRFALLAASISGDTAPASR